MRADVVWWDLDGTGQTVESLRAQLRADGAQEWTRVPGLVLKLWVADPAGGRWGAVMVWDPDRPALGLPPNRAAELIGRPPTHRARFDVEALAWGPGPAPARTAEIPFPFPH